MGLKCRLFGHTYGTPEVERSREEEGDEVVVTIRNVKRCERCGDEQMVNQTKEVTSVRTPEEVGLNAADGTSATPEPTGESDATPNTSGPGSADGESPVTPVEPEPGPTTAEPDDPVDATVGPDPEAAETAADRQDGVGEGVAAAPDEGGADAQSDPDGRTGDDRDWDEDAVVEEPDSPTVQPAEESQAEGPDDGWETGSDDWDDVEPDPDVDDAVILDPGETERDEVQWPEESTSDPDAATDADDGTADTADPVEPQSAEEDPAGDAEIIDAGEVEADPAGGSAAGWSDHEEAGTAGGWPEHDDVDEGYSATPNGDVDAEFEGSGLTPEVNGGAPDDSAAVDGITVGGAGGRAAERTHAGADGDADDSGTGQGFVRAGESTTESDVPADRIEFYCPNCGYARVAGTSSMRAGDICPECKRGYIAEREQ